MLTRKTGLDCKGLLDADVDQELLKRAKQIYNSGSDESFFKLRETPELAFALLRLFLRKMPHSLIPDEYYHDFVATTGAKGASVAAREAES